MADFETSEPFYHKLLSRCFSNKRNINPVPLIKKTKISGMVHIQYLLRSLFLINDL